MHSARARTKRKRGNNEEIFSAKEQIWVSMRQIQRATGCATTTLNMALDVLKPHLKLDDHQLINVRGVDKRMCKIGGAHALKLNGCVGNDCNGHVYLPSSPLLTCPTCGHPRFNARGKPNEVCWYFPLREQLRELFKRPGFRELLMHEVRRKRNPAVMSDVYDTPRWHQIMGPPSQHLSRIAIQVCVDGIPAHNRQACGSVKPLQSNILSLAPWLRYRADYMLVHMLIPAHLKGISLTNISVTKISVTKISVTKISVSKISVSKISVTKISVSKISVSKISVTKISVSN